MKLKSCLTKAVQGFFLLWAGVLLVYSLSLSVQAQDTASVTATVTAQQIAVSVSDGTVNYGVIEMGGNKSTLDLTDTQTITNDGNVTEDFNIQGSDSTPSSWTLVGNTAPGTDEYGHAFSTDTGSTWTPMTSDTYTSVATAIASSATEDMDLQIYTPSSTTATAEQSVDVTIQATAN